MIGNLYEKMIRRAEDDGFETLIEKTVDDLESEMFSIITEGYIGFAPESQKLADYGEVILVFGIIVAISYNKVYRKDESVKPFKVFVDAANKVLGRAVAFLVGLTPYAVTSLIARAVGRSQVADLLPLLGTLVLSYVLCVIQLFGVES